MSVSTHAITNIFLRVCSWYACMLRDRRVAACMSGPTPTTGTYSRRPGCLLHMWSRLLLVTRASTFSLSPILSRRAYTLDLRLLSQTRPRLTSLGVIMDVDPPGSPKSPPEGIRSSTSLKRSQDHAPEDAASASKRQKPDGPQTVEEGERKAEEGGETGEVSTPGEKGKRKEREKERKGGGRNKRQRGKKGEEKDYVRNRRRGTRPEGEEAPAAENGESKGPRLPKRQCALLIGFCGDGFNGMQMYVDMPSCGVRKAFIAHGAPDNQTPKHAPLRVSSSMP